MIARLLDAAIVLVAAAVLLAIADAGINFEYGFLRIRIQDWLRPGVVLAILLAVRASHRPHLAHPTHLALIALLLACTGVYLQHQVRVAGGLDSYGYVSTARLLAAGRLSEPQPLARVLPFENAMSAATPLGHVPRADGEASVPRFPIGLPLVMAAFRMFGPQGPFFVPLVMALVAMALMVALTRAAPNAPSAPNAPNAPNAPIAPVAPVAPVAPLLAAALLAVDPLFAAYAMQPMSDVPATCWMLAAVWLALGEWARRSIGGTAAGLCAGMAILTRPALFPAVLVLLALTWLSKRDVRKATTFAAVVLAVVVIQAGLNLHMYGSPVASGYGTASHMFELSITRLSANVSNFGRWLTYSHTPLFWLMWPAALLVLRRQPWAWQVSAVAAAAAAPYMFYIVFDDWESSRFLLPAIALVIVLFARALAHLTHLTHLAHPAHLGFFLIALACAAGSHRFLEREGIYRLATLEAKYALAGEWFRNNTSERAVVLASLHSGTIRMYGDRQSIRWDQIPQTGLGETVQRLAAAGYEPYLALDLPSEPPLFEERFHEKSAGVEQIARVRVVNIYKFMSAY